LDKLDLPRCGYPFAIVSIAITDWIVALLKARALDGHFGSERRGSAVWPSEAAGRKGRGASESTPLLGAQAEAASNDGKRADSDSYTVGTAADISGEALATLNAIHAAALLVFDAVWWSGGVVEAWVPDPGSARAAARSGSTRGLGFGTSQVADWPGGGMRGDVRGDRNGVIFAAAAAVVAGSPNSGVGTVNPMPLSVMDFPRVFRSYKARFELLLRAEVE
jgi:hypothetical protein